MGKKIKGKQSNKIRESVEIKHRYELPRDDIVAGRMHDEKGR